MDMQDTRASTNGSETQKTETTLQEEGSASPTLKDRRGFATMARQRQREIAAMGGKAVPPSSRSFSLDRELAREAGRKGGLAVPKEKRSFSVDRDLAKRSGRKGGSVS